MTDHFRDPSLTNPEPTEASILKQRETRARAGINGRYFISANRSIRGSSFRAETASISQQHCTSTCTLSGVPLVILSAYRRHDEIANNGERDLKGIVTPDSHYH